ncbi:MAG: extracellular solute-binding protein [Planctomycetota bacterium]|jgi:multiple sugar transport system permease protein
MKRLLPALLALLVMVAPGAWGADDAEAPATPRGKVKLRIAEPPSSSAQVYMRAIRAIFDEYVRTHPDVELEASGGLTLEGGVNNDLLAIVGGVSADVFSLYFQKMHSYIDQGFVLPMDEYIQQWEGAGDVPEQLWEVVTAADGRRYGAIYNWPTNYLIYRRDLFRQEGLDPDNPPKNWDELFDAAKRLTRPDLRVETAFNPDAGTGRYGLFLPYNSVYNFSNFVWQAGGDFVHRREDNRWEAIFDGEGAVKALEFYKRLRWTEWSRGNKVYTGVIRTGFGEAQAYRESRLFAKGEVAMVVMGLHRLQDVLSENIVRLEDVGIAPLPAGPTGIRASIVDGDIWCMASRLKDDPEKRKAAWEYIRFMTSDTAKRIETRTYVEAGVARFVRNPHWLEQFGYEDYFREIDQQHIRAYDEALKNGRPEPYAPHYAALSYDLQVPLSRVIRDPDADPRAELEAVAKRVNTHLYKLHPEEEMKFKRKVFFGIAVGAVLVLSFIGYQLVRGIAARVAAAKSGLSGALKSSRWKHIYAWLFLFPAVGTILLWRYVPLIRGSVMSFYDWKIFGDKIFIGLDNFIEAVGQPLFWRSMVHTFEYTAFTLALGFFTPIFLALFLSEVPRFKITFRVLFYLPALTSGLVIMFLWKDLFFDASSMGLLNRMITTIGIPAQKWLQDPKLAMLCIVIPGAWAGAGPGSIIYLAALRTVPAEMYEAAEIDGAGPFQKVFRVALPYLKPLILINFIGAFIGSFHSTQRIFVMTMGGPEKATHTLSLEIWFNAFLYLKFGYATAMAWIMGSMLIGFTLYQLRIFQRVQFTAGGATAE